jgi:hypothetical protein
MHCLLEGVAVGSMTTSLLSKSLWHVTSLALHITRPIPRRRRRRRWRSGIVGPSGLLTSAAALAMVMALFPLFPLLRLLAIWLLRGILLSVSPTVPPRLTFWPRPKVGIVPDRSVPLAGLFARRSVVAPPPLMTRLLPVPAERVGLAVAWIFVAKFIRTFLIPRTAFTMAALTVVLAVVPAPPVVLPPFLITFALGTAWSALLAPLVEMPVPRWRIEGRPLGWPPVIVPVVTRGPVERRVPIVKRRRPVEGWPPIERWAVAVKRRTVAVVPMWPVERRSVKGRAMRVEWWPVVIEGRPTKGRWRPEVKGRGPPRVEGRVAVEWSRVVEGRPMIWWTPHGHR